MTTFRIPLRPIAWQRTGGQGRRRFMRPESRAFRKALQLAVVADLFPHRPVVFPMFPEGALEVDIVAGPTRGDRDNVEKAISDALNGILWADDKQIVKGKTEVYRKGEPMIELKVRRCATR